jgi:hypothetical protein
MNKKQIRLTESDLHRIVKRSVNKVLNEVAGVAAKFGGGIGDYTPQPALGNDNSGEMKRALLDLKQTLFVASNKLNKSSANYQISGEMQEGLIDINRQIENLRNKCTQLLRGLY